MTVAALYLRVSTEDQARHGYSLASQVEACRTRAEALGATQILTFADEGVSGALLSRPGLGALREAVRANRVDLVVVLDPDRLARNLSHQLVLTEEIERAKIRLEFVNFEWKATAEGQLFYALRGAIAQYEKEKIKERTGRGRLQKAKEGKLPLAFRPYGYRYDPEASLLTVDPVEATVVREIFRRLLEEQEGPNGIARRLNQLGAPTRKGGPWHRGVVRQILANPVYTGIFYANRYDTAGCSLNRHRPKSERVSALQRPRAEWVPVTVPALIAPEVWQEAQAVLERSRRLWAGKPCGEYLLSGLLQCGACGHPMAGFTGTDWGVRVRKYSCRKGWAGGREGWCGRAVAAAPLEDAVWLQIMGWMAERADLLEAALAGRTEREPAAIRELSCLAEALARAEAGRRAVVSVLEQGALAPADAADALARIAARIAELSRRQAGLRSLLATGPSPPPPGGDVPAGSTPPGGDLPAGSTPPGATLRTKLDQYRTGGLPPADRKQLVRMLVTRIDVQEETAILHARWPEVFAAQGLKVESKS